MRPSRRQVQGVRQQDHQGRDGPRRRSLLRVLAVGLRTFWKLTNSKDFLSCTLLPLLGAPRPVRCGPYTAACSAPPVARHLSGEARRSRNRGPAASLARRGSPGPLRERSTHHEHATRLGDCVFALRCETSAIPHEVWSVGFKT